VTDLKPGPELDAEIARVVMGWKKTEHYLEEGICHSNFRSRAWDTGDGGLIAEEYIPKYSTDIAAAWEVVERIAQIDPKCDVQIELVQDSMALPDKWFCSLMDHDDKNVKFANPNAEAASAISAPHAICLAALKAVENA